jgi:transcriptional regulator with XRE-family HTH domain
MEIGEKIKLLRRNMTQADLSQRSGIDKAIISKIENGKMRGTMDCHKKLAEVFGLKLSEFYAYLEEEKTQPAQMHRGDAKTDVYQGFLEILTNVPLSKKMLPTFITLKPGQEMFLEEIIKKVERFIYVISGNIDIEVENKTYSLKKDAGLEKGDSLYSTSSRRHQIKNTGDVEAKVLCISAPPVL